MPNPWTETEDRLVVTDYLLMLREHREGKKVNKTATRRALLANLNSRSEASIEFKRCNVSAVLEKRGIAWLPGYRPAKNYQRSLEKTVTELLPLIGESATPPTQLTP